jgi:hypothetical protein
LVKQNLVEFDNHPEPNELEISDKRIKRAKNKKALKQILKLKTGLILIHQGSWKCKILEGTW